MGAEKKLMIRRVLIFVLPWYEPWHLDLTEEEEQCLVASAWLRPLSCSAAAWSWPPPSSLPFCCTVENTTTRFRYKCVVRTNEKKREKKKASAVPFGGVEAEAEEREREFHDPLCACGSFAYDGHGEVEEWEESDVWGFKVEKTRKVTVFFREKKIIKIIIKKKRVRKREWVCRFSFFQKCSVGMNEYWVSGKNVAVMRGKTLRIKKIPSTGILCM